MLHYFILDQEREQFSNNTTIKIGEGDYANTIVCFNPITLQEDETLHYQIEILYLCISGEECVDITDKQLDELYKITHPMFLDLLQLFKGNINYD